MSVGRLVRSTVAAMVVSSMVCATATAATAVRARVMLDQAQGLPGSLVTGHGEGFDHWSVDQAPDRIGGEDFRAAWTNAGPARIHWNSLHDAVVWEGAPGLDGSFSFSFRVPADASPGEYTVVATQTGYDGMPSGGTPARAAFRVVGGQPAQAAPAPARPRTEAPAAREDTARQPRRVATRVPAAAHPATRSSSAGEVSTSLLPTSRGRPARNDGAAHPAAPSTAASSGSSAARRPESSTQARAARDRTEWYLLGLAGLAVGGLLGAAGTLIVIRRRRWPQSPLAKPAPAPEAPDAVERELQEMVAQEPMPPREPVGHG